MGPYSSFVPVQSPILLVSAAKFSYTPFFFHQLFFLTFVAFLLSFLD
jgi:hypothetical protein